MDATDIATLAQHINFGIGWLENEAATADRNGDTDRASRKRAAVATVRRYAATVTASTDRTEAELVAHIAAMSAVFFESGHSDTTAAALQSLVDQGVLVRIADEGERPFVALAGYYA